MTDNEILNRFNQIDKTLKTLATQVSSFDSALKNKASISDLSRNMDSMNSLIRDVNNSMQKIEERLGKVLLPAETRMYLEEGEVESFQSNTNTLKAMLTKFDKLYKNLVAYQSKS